MSATPVELAQRRVRLARHAVNQALDLQHRAAAAVARASTPGERRRWERLLLATSAQTRRAEHQLRTSQAELLLVLRATLGYAADTAAPPPAAGAGTAGGG